MYPKMYSNKLSKKQQGIGLPATVFIIVILALIVAAMGDLTESSNLGFGQDYQSMRAFYAAESGAQIALNRVFVGKQTCGALVNIDFGFNLAGAVVADNPGLDNCVAQISCSESIVVAETYYIFSSNAVCGSGFDQARRSIEVRAKQ